MAVLKTFGEQSLACHEPQRCGKAASCCADLVQRSHDFEVETSWIHLADGEKRTEPGSLPFDYRPGFRALKKWGYAGWLTVESKFSDTPEAALSRALKYLKRLWAEA